MSSSKKPQGCLFPPDGLTPFERNNWWIKHPEEIIKAFQLGIFPKEDIEYAKKLEQAFDIIDPEKGKRYSNEVKSILLANLTGLDGFEIAPKKRGPKVKDKLYLEVATKVEGLTGREANRKAREIAGDKYHGNTNKLMEKSRKAKAKYDQIVESIIAEIEQVLSTVERPEDLPDIDKIKLLILKGLAESLGEDLDQEEAILNWLISSKK